MMNFHVELFLVRVAKTITRFVEPRNIDNSMESETVRFEVYNF